MDNLTKEKSNLIKMIGVLAIVLCLYFGVKTVAELKGYKFIGGGIPASNTMSFDGKGEVTAVPDLATVSFTLRDTEKDLKSAQDKVTAKETAVLKFLDSQNIAKKDIKTENYSSYPRYEYMTTNQICPINGYCPSGKQVLTGYEVSENISVKVRDIAKAGDIIKGLGAAGVSELSGPNFSIENEDKLKAEARKMAIDDAKAKAKVLAGDLGVSLVRIVNFSEGGNYPIYYAKQGMAMDSASAPSAPAPELPTGENKITSNVTVTYEIR